MATGIIETPYSDLINASGAEIFQLGVFNNNSKTLHFSGNVRGIVFFVSATTSASGMYLLYAGNGSTNNLQTLVASSSISFSSGTGTLTITCSAALRGYILLLEGNEYISL